MRHTLAWLIRGLVPQRPNRRRGARHYVASPAECLEVRKNLSAGSLTSALLVANPANHGAAATAPAAPNSASTSSGRTMISGASLASGISNSGSNQSSGQSTSSGSPQITGASIAAGLSTQPTVARVTVSDPNDQISEAVYMGSITSSSTEYGTIDSPTDVDMFQVNVTAGQRLSFDVDVTGRFDSVIRLFNSSGRQLKSNDDGAAPGEYSSRESYLEYTFTSGGSYYLGVSGYRNSSYNAVTGTGDTNGSTGEYDLTVQSISSGPVDPPVVRFDTEGNNSFSQANFIGVYGRGYTSDTQYGSTGAGSDTQDWICFRLAGRTTGTIQVTGTYQDLDLELYNSSGSLLARSANAGTRTDTINLNGLAAGTYYARVYPGVYGARSAYAMRFGLSVD